MIKNDLSEIISLDGSWDFTLGEKSHLGKIETPSCWETAGYSKFIDGPAFFKRRIPIPENWEGQNILAEFDAVSYACVFSVNGVEIGEHCGLWTPFSMDITSIIQPGNENTLELAVFKPGERYPMRSTLAGFLPDVATTFGGIWQPARLRALQIGLADLQIETHLDTQHLDIKCRPVLFTNKFVPSRWEIKIYHQDREVVHHSIPFIEGDDLFVSLKIQDLILWSPNNPSLYHVEVCLFADNNRVAQVFERVGFRSLTTDGDQLILNGHPIQVRGILSWGWEPEMIAPAYSADMAKAEMRKVRELGFNLIKLCLFVPNQTYFDAADEEGMLLWQEWPMWQPDITPENCKNISSEYTEFTYLTRNHPSVVIYSLGCELSDVVDECLLSEINYSVRSSVKDVLVCDNSGSCESYGGLDFDFSDFTDYHPYFDLHYFEPLLDNWRRDWQVLRPWIFGEFCDSDTFRVVDEIIHANNGLKHWWMTTDNPITEWRSESQAMLEVEDRLSKAQLTLAPEELVKTSYAQSMVVRKYTLETLRRRRGIGGYVITGLRDTPISTSGIWDDLSQPKWTQEEFRKVNDDAVLSLDMNRRRRWHNGGDRPDRLDVYNHWAGTKVRWYVILNGIGHLPQPGSRFNWSLINGNGLKLGSGAFLIEKAVFPGVPCDIGLIRCQLPSVDLPTELQLEVTLNADGFTLSNNWNIYVYPRLSGSPPDLAIVDPTYTLDEWGDLFSHLPKVPQNESVSNYKIIISTIWNDHLNNFVQNGGKVIFLQQGDGPLPVRRCPFWRESVILFPKHASWETFPQRGYAGPQFFRIASDRAFVSQEIMLSLNGAFEINPIMRRLDAREFHISDYLFEAKIGKGMMIGCTLQLQGGQGAQPFGLERNVAGAALLNCLLDYFKSV